MGMVGTAVGRSGTSGESASSSSIDVRRPARSTGGAIVGASWLSRQPPARRDTVAMAAILDQPAAVRAMDLLLLGPRFDLKRARAVRTAKNDLCHEIPDGCKSRSILIRHLHTLAPRGRGWRAQRAG